MLEALVAKVLNELEDTADPEPKEKLQVRFCSTGANEAAPEKGTAALD